jgi:hypothetical protein
MDLLAGSGYELDGSLGSIIVRMDTRVEKVAGKWATDAGIVELFGAEELKETQMTLYNVFCLVGTNNANASQFLLMSISQSTMRTYIL